MIGFLKYKNENLFLERVNKIILTEYSQFYMFMKKLKEVEKGITNIEYNNLKLTNKNTLIIDLSSISSLINEFSNDSKLIGEYIKLKFKKMIFLQTDEEILNNIMNQYLLKMFGNKQAKNIEIDYLKLLKNYSNIELKTQDDFVDIIKFVLDSDYIKNVIVIYKKSILNEFKLQEIEYIQSDKMCLFEICNKESRIDIEDNILFFDKEITQIRASDFFDLIINKSMFCKNENKETYSYLINKILFYSIDRKEVDIMKRYKNEISELVEILQKEFNISLNDTLDYI